jgi:hypothetical protein
MQKSEFVARALFGACLIWIASCAQLAGLEDSSLRTDAGQSRGGSGGTGGTGGGNTAGSSAAGSSVRDAQADGTGGGGQAGRGGLDAAEAGSPDVIDGGAGDGGTGEAGGCAGLVCNGACVPNDARNCGVCGHDCTQLSHVSGPVTCVSGKCAFPLSSCASPWSHCSTNPDDGCEVDFSKANNCGACGTVCPSSSPVCSASGGTYGCATNCPAAMPTLCGATCVDTKSNALHCSMCDHPCSTTVTHSQPACQNNACTFVCNTNYTSCGGACVDEKTDNANCGGCGSAYACTGGKQCMGGTCQCTTGNHVCNGTCLPDSDKPSNPNDPCVIDEAFGIFASPSGNDTTGDGTRVHPYATVGRAMDAAAAAKKRVYACGTAGAYTENLVVGSSRAGLSVYGGFDCATWTYQGTKATIAPAAAGYALAINGAGVSFEDFAFQSLAGSLPGESSVAVFASNANGVVFRRCQIVAQGGAQGRDQVQGAMFAGPAPDGKPTMSFLPGEGGINPDCPTSTGGNGGTNADMHYAGYDGQPLVNPASGLANNNGCPSCPSGSTSTGGPGYDGLTGSIGGGAASWATFTASGWQPTGGQSGGPGGVAQGGGGGAYGSRTSPNLSWWGGGGGAGGCGGQPGTGGTGGGSSIAVLAFGSSITLDSCTLLSANAGRGGNGAPGEVGQMGGVGGNASCKGGRGGKGGDGGPGGGGAGGLSAGVVWAGTAPIMSATTVAFGTAGGAGAGGASGPNSGKAGIAQSVVPFM